MAMQFNMKNRICFFKKSEYFCRNFESCNGIVFQYVMNNRFKQTVKITR